MPVAAPDDIDAVRTALARILDPTWAIGPNARARAVFSEVRRLAIEPRRAAAVSALPLLLRVVAQAVVADRIDLVRRYLKVWRGLRAVATASDAEWCGPRLCIALTVRLLYADGSPLMIRPTAGKILWVPPPMIDRDAIASRLDPNVSEGLMASTAALLVRRRDKVRELHIPASLRVREGTGGEVSFDVSTDFDPTEAHEGGRLSAGRWDLYLEVAVLGWNLTARVPSGRSVPSTMGAVQAYQTVYGNLSLVLEATDEFGRGGARRALRRFVPSPVRQRLRRVVARLRSAR